MAHLISSGRSSRPLPLSSRRAHGHSRLLRRTIATHRRHRVSESPIADCNCRGARAFGDGLDQVASRQGCLMPRTVSKGLHLRIHNVVSRIPRGRVATYGQVARLAGMPGQARLVGYALHALPAGTSVPWQRVVNALGAISTPPGHDALQRRLLEREGIRFDARGRIPLAAFQWRPRRSPSRTL